MLRLDRTRRAGAWLEWKVRLFTVGALLALAGMALNERWLVGVAMAVLVAGMLLRFLPAADGNPTDEEVEGGAPR